MKDAFSKERKASPTISLSFDQFELGDMSLDHAVIDSPSETSSHRIFVFLDPTSKGLQLREMAVFYLSQPRLEALCSCACAHHLSKLLNQVIGPIDFWMDQAEPANLLPFLDVELLRTTKQEEGSLPRGGQSRCHRFTGSLIFAPGWQQTHQRVANTLIGSLVALLGKFSEEMGHIVATLFPSRSQVGEIPINLAGLLTWLALGKCACSQPTLHGAGTHSDLPSDDCLTHSLLVQGDDLLIASQTLFASVLLKLL